jgi:glycosyltransferase involved in cell wall biosynthesis
MHICFLTNEYPKEGFPHGGVGSFVKNLSINLVGKGHTVTIIGINYTNINEVEYESNIKIIRLKKKKVKGLTWFLNHKKITQEIKKRHKENPIDIIETSELGFAFLTKFENIKYVIRLHGGHHFFALSENRKINFWKALQEKRSFKKADAFIAVSNYVGLKTQEYLKNNFLFETIYNSVDINKFSPSSIDLIQKNTLLFVGSICEKKGIRQLVLAMSKIKKEIPDVKLKIIGRDWFFPNGNSYIEYLKTFIDDDLIDAIEIIGPVSNDNIPKYLDVANICVYPSHMEAMPIAWLEALSNGKIVVASDIGPGREAIINGKTGILVNPHDPEDIADAIIKVLNNLDKSYEMGINARIKILESFNPEKILNQNIDFYKSII